MWYFLVVCEPVLLEDLSPDVRGFEDHLAYIFPHFDYFVLYGKIVRVLLKKNLQDYRKGLRELF